MRKFSQSAINLGHPFNEEPNEHMKKTTPSQIGKPGDGFSGPDGGIALKPDAKAIGLPQYSHCELHIAGSRVYNRFAF